MSMPLNWTDALRRRFPTLSTAWGLLLAYVLILHVLLALGFPTGWKQALFVLALVGLPFTSTANGLLIAVSLVISAGMLEVGLRVGGFDKFMYYRPHEMLARNYAPWGGHYRANSVVTMMQPFSNLQAMANVGIIEPREIEWVTDSRGFRNRRDYHGQKWVLVGDSFVAGEANTQRCTLNEELLEKYGIDSYNLSHPGDDLPHYVQKMRVFREQVPGNYKFVLFLFEGNDFSPAPYEALLPREQTPLRAYQQVFKESALYRVTAWLTARVTAKGKPLPIVRAHIAGQEVVFLQNAIGALTNPPNFNEETMKWKQALAPYIGRIVFIPDRYRVMHPHVDNGGSEVVPHAAWDYTQKLAHDLGIPATDLTSYLIAAEGQLKLRGEHTFWRADTHWNCNGTQVAASVVADILKHEN